MFFLPLAPDQQGTCRLGGILRSLPAPFNSWLFHLAPWCLPGLPQPLSQLQTALPAREKDIPVSWMMNQWTHQCHLSSHRRVCNDLWGRLQVIVSRFMEFPSFFPIYPFLSDRGDIWRLRYQSLRKSCTEIWTCVLQCISLHHDSYKSLYFVLPKHPHMLLCEKTQIWGKGKKHCHSSELCHRAWLHPGTGSEILKPRISTGGKMTSFLVSLRNLLEVPSFFKERRELKAMGPVQCSRWLALVGFGFTEKTCASNESRASQISCGHFVSSHRTKEGWLEQSSPSALPRRCLCHREKGLNLPAVNWKASESWSTLLLWHSLCLILTHTTQTRVRQKFWRLK